MNQLDFSTAPKAVAGGLVALFTFLFGEPNDWLMALLSLVVIDYFTGVIAGVVHKELSSKKGLKGIAKKVFLLAVVAVAHIIDQASGLSGTVEGIVIAFFLANEGLSIIENAAKMGLPIPKKLVNLLQQLRTDNEEDTLPKETQNEQR